jgi:hypothetical protein
LPDAGREGFISSAAHPRKQKEGPHDLAAPVMNRKPDLSIGLCHG